MRVLVNQLEHASLCSVSLSEARLHQSRIATVSLCVARGDVIEEVLDQVFSVDHACALLDGQLLGIRLTGEDLRIHRRRAGVADEDRSGLAARMKRVVLPPGDQLLNNALSLFGTAKGGSNIAVPYELAGKVRQQRPALIAGQSQFAAVYKVSHGVS